MVSKMILSSSKLRCSEEIITIAAILSVQVIFFFNILSVSRVQQVWIANTEFLNKKNMWKKYS